MPGKRKRMQVPWFTIFFGENYLLHFVKLSHELDELHELHEFFLSKPLITRMTRIPDFFLRQLHNEPVEITQEDQSGVGPKKIFNIQRSMFNAQ